MKKYELYRVSDYFGDSTANYEIELLCDITVQEFIEEVLKDKREWGRIGIYNGCWYEGKPQCEYKYGKLLSNLPEEYLSKRVASATSNGGWTNMDYLLKVE